MIKIWRDLKLEATNGLVDQKEFLVFIILLSVPISLFKFSATIQMSRPGNCLNEGCPGRPKHNYLTYY